MLWVLFGPWGGDRSESPPCCGYYSDLGGRDRYQSPPCCGYYLDLGVEIALSHRHVVGIIRTLGWRSLSVTAMLWVLFGHWVGDRSQSPPCCGYYSDIGLEIALSHRHVVGIIWTLGWRSLSVTAMLWVLFGPWVGDRSQSPPCCGYYSDIGLKIALSHRHVVGIIWTLG